jgi:thioesterase domain-containing protein
MLDTDLGVRTVFEAPTPAELAARITAGTQPGRDSLGVLLPIRAAGTRPPLFGIHPSGGMSWGYAPLTRYVPPGIPLYGVQSLALDGTGQIPESLHELASTCLACIRTVQPDGPYYLLGWSFGGNLGHEIAVQMQAAGQPVAALILMDAYPARRHLPTAQSPDPADHQARQAGPMPGAISEEDRLRLERIRETNEAPRGEHKPGVFRGPALLLVATEGRPVDQPAAAPWSPHITGPITEVPIGCQHLDMARPENLAQIWRATSAWLGLEG